MVDSPDDSPVPGEGPSPSSTGDQVGTAPGSPKAFGTVVGIIARARAELQELTGYKVDSVSSFERMEGGWQLTMTAVELRRIPAATDVLASYVVTLNDAGDIVTYRRDKRYYRDQVGEAQ
jgi:hypothetical protein